MNLIGIAVGIFLIGFSQYVETQSGRRFEYKAYDMEVGKDMVLITLDKYIGQQNEILPHGFELPEVIKEKVPDVAYLAVFVVSFLGLLVFANKQKNGFFKWIFVMLFTLVFFALSMCSLIFFLNYTKNPIVLQYVKPIIIDLFKIFTDINEVKRIFVTENIVFVKLFEKHPQSKLYFVTFIENVNKLGLTTPLLLLVVGIFLFKKEIQAYTRVLLVWVLTLLVTVQTSMDLVGKGLTPAMCLVYSLIFLIVVVFVVNFFIGYGHYLLLPFIAINATQLIIMFFRVFVVDVFPLFLAVYGLTIFYIYVWKKGYQVIAAALIFAAFVQIIPVMNVSHFIATIFLVTGLLA